MAKLKADRSLLCLLIVVCNMHSLLCIIHYFFFHPEPIFYTFSISINLCNRIIFSYINFSWFIFISKMSCNNTILVCAVFSVLMSKWSDMDISCINYSMHDNYMSVIDHAKFIPLFFGFKMQTKSISFAL